MPEAFARVDTVPDQATSRLLFPPVTIDAGRKVQRHTSYSQSFCMAMLEDVQEFTSVLKLDRELIRILIHLGGEETAFAISCIKRTMAR